MAFTALLYLRPQEQLPFLGALHLAELAALGALGAMIFGRIGRGLPVTRVTPELFGVVALGVVILATAPFSIWMGGAIGTFTDLYVKVLLIFVLMLNTLTSPKRIEQFAWLIVMATAYIAFRAVFDYARGINLVENGRVQGAVGGMFKNPNDLALNMVAILPLAVTFLLRSTTTPRRLFAGGAGLLMFAATIVSHSRSGSIGLAVMVLFLAAVLVRKRPGLVFAAALVTVMALPLLPSSYWHRLSSITNPEEDDTGSREARRILLIEAYNAFLSNPLTGVGAGQFKNYNPEGRVEAWRETHNSVLQVAAELGVLGLGVFLFLIVRAATAGRGVRRLLRRARGMGARKHGPPAPSVVTDEEAAVLESHMAGMRAAIAGWIVCALFASVAYHWTFYYLLALAIAPREVLLDRLGRARKRATAAAPIVQRVTA